MRRGVTVLSGFLGSGKTTFLRGALRGERDAAVIINEYGETALDGAMVDMVAEDRVVVGGGCICCTKRADLADAMLRRLDAEERALASPTRRLIIETSGLADPAPVLFTITSDPVLRHHYAADEVCVMVDAVGGERNLDRHPEAVKQVTAADRLVITKIDLAGAGVVEALAGGLHELNPAARIDLAERGEVVRTVAGPQPARRRRERADGAAGTAAHLAEVASVSIGPDEPVNWQAFCVWLTMLLYAHGEKVLRVKGVVDTGDGAVAVNGVQHVVHAPEHLPGRPDGEGLVIIGRGIDPAEVRRSFAVFQRLGGE